MSKLQFIVVDHDMMIARRCQSVVPTNRGEGMGKPA
jgi:predicted ABC-type transport system involved in lysophospholipase L1 biosynthesis ATPase subunit